MPTFRHGRDTVILVDDNDLSDNLRDATTARTLDTPETTAFGSTVKTYVTGMIDGRLTLSGMFSADAGDIDPTMDSIYGVATPPVVCHAMEGTAVGRRLNIMKAHSVSYQVQGTVSDMVSANVEMASTEGVYSGYSLFDFNTALTADTNGTSIDLGAGASYQSWVATIHIVSDATTVADPFIVIEDSADDAVFATITGFTQHDVTGTGGAYQSYNGTAPEPRRYIRARFALNGATAGAGVQAQVNLAPRNTSVT